MAYGVLSLTILLPLAYFVLYHLTAASELNRFNREVGRDASLSDDVTDSISAENTRKLLERNSGPLPKKQP